MCVYGGRVWFGSNIESNLVFRIPYLLQNGDSAVTSDCSVKCWCRSSTLNCISPHRCGTHSSCHQDGNVGQCKCLDGYYGDGDKCEPLPSDCLKWYKMGFREDNVYEISPVGWNRPNVNVYCDMRSGGWTVSILWFSSIQYTCWNYKGLFIYTCDLQNTVKCP